MEPSENPWTRATLFSTICVLMVAGGLALLLLNVRPKPLTPPTQLEKYAANDGSFQFMAPKGWNKSSREIGGNSSRATFKQAGGRVVVTTDLAGSLVADIAKSSPGSLEGISGMLGSASGDVKAAMEAVKVPVIQKLHDSGKEDTELVLLASGYDNYQEAPSKPFANGFGESRVSEFTADGGMLYGKIKGIRVTSLSVERRITTRCYAPEADWSKSGAALVKIAATVSPGVPK